MAWFDSIFIYILFAVYLAFLVFKWRLPKGFLGNSSKERPINPSKGTLVTQFMSRVDKDLEQFKD